MEEFNAYEPEHSIMYVEANDTFIHKIANDEIELWKGKNHQTDEGIKHLYGIGAYAWIWELTTPDDICVIAQRIEDFLWELDTYEHRDQYDSRKELVKEITLQLQDLKILKQAITILYGKELTEEELYNQLSELLKV